MELKEIALIVVAFFHFLLVEMRPLILLWYAGFHTFEDIIRKEIALDAYGTKNISGCIHSGIIGVQDVEDCAKAAYRRYLRDGPQMLLKSCSDECPGSGVGMNFRAPRDIFYFFNIWLAFSLVVLLVFFICRHPGYFSGSYIKFTQTLYANKWYWAFTALTIFLSDLFIILAVIILTGHDKEWTEYIVPLILAAKSSRDIILMKSSGVDITTNGFCQLEISRGKGWFGIPLVFFFKKNSAILHEMEVGYLKKGLPDGLQAARDDPNKPRWRQFLESVNSFIRRFICSSSNENTGEAGNQQENVASNE